MNKKFLNTREASEYLNVSVRHLFRLRNEYGKVKFYQDGRIVRFKVEDLDAYIEQYVEQPFGNKGRGYE